MTVANVRQVRIYVFFTLLGLIEQSTAQTTGTAVSGRVLDAETATPVANVRVGCAVLGWTATDSEGRYRLGISDVPENPAAIWVNAGVQTIAGPVTKPTFVTLRQGQQLQKVDFRVRLTAQLSGRVFGQNGEPLLGINVVAVAKRYERSPWSWKDVSIGDWNYSVTGIGTATTDDTGRYSLRIYAGRPHWILAYRQMTAAPRSDAPVDAEQRLKTLVPTFYPKARSH